MLKLEVHHVRATDANPKARRKVPRRSMNQRVGILVAGRYMLGGAYEIGEGGILIDGPENLEKGQRLVISLRIPGILTGVVLGHIVYVLNSDTRKTRYGIEFDKISFELKRKIRLYVASSHTALGQHADQR